MQNGRGAAQFKRGHTTTCHLQIGPPLTSLPRPRLDAGIVNDTIIRALSSRLERASVSHSRIPCWERRRIRRLRLARNSAAVTTFLQSPSPCQWVYLIHLFSMIKLSPLNRLVSYRNQEFYEPLFSVLQLLHSAI